MRTKWLAIAAPLAAALGLGCRSQPAPLTAQAGTSFTLMLAGESTASNPDGPLSINNVGFNSTWYDGDISDVQRGEVKFYLYKDGAETPLETELVTRIFPDPASDVGLQNGGIFFPLGQDEFGMGQLVALIYIPEDTAADSYFLRARKKVGGATTELTYNEPFEVLDNGSSGDHRTSSGSLLIGDLYPHPKLLVWLVAVPPQPDPPPPPSAAHLEIEIQSGTDIQVLDVIEEQHFGRRSVLTWTPVGNRIQIDFVNLEPHPTVKKLAVVFEPTDPATFTRISDVNASFPFHAADSKFWDIDGDELTVGPVTLGPIR